MLAPPCGIGQKAGMTTGHSLTLSGAALIALPSGGLFWPDEGLLCVSDLHLGRSERMARRAGALLPPYDSAATLTRLDADIEAVRPVRVVCLGDSFDDRAAAEAMDEVDRLWLLRLMAGRDWLWIEGNHDPGPIDIGGAHLESLKVGPLSFRHIAEPDSRAEVSGHFHPKARIAGLSRPCFVTDGSRLVLPAYGSYTGGLDCTAPALRDLFGKGARVILTGTRPIVAPLDQISPRASSLSR